MPWPAKPYSEWASDDLAELLIDPKPEENAHRDFKLCSCLLDKDNKKAQEKARTDLLKDIAAMANGVGGALLIGVRQTQNPNGPQVAESLDGISEDETKRYEKAIKELVDTNLEVRPASLRFSAINVPHDSSRKILIVEVPQNTYSLSMVTFNALNQFWIRRGDDNKPMTTDEIQYAFDRMARVRESAQDELTRIHNAFWSDRKGKMYVWFAAVPIQRARDHVPVDIPRINEMLQHSSYHVAYPDVNDSFCIHKILQDDVVPSLLGVRNRPSDSDVVHAEIRRDGTIVLARIIPDHPASILRLWEVYDLWCFGLHLLKDVQDTFGVSRIAITQAGLIRSGGFQVVIGPRDRNPMAIEDDEVPMDSIMLPDNWSTGSIFTVWAAQFANYLRRPKAIVLPPWVTQ